MATNCDYIEENLNDQKCGISNSASVSSMTQEEKQDSTEKSHSESSFSNTSSELGNSGSIKGSALQKSKKSSINGKLPLVPSIGDCAFEDAFDKSMEDLEHGIDGYESDSETSVGGDRDQEPCKQLHSINSDNLTCSTGLGSVSLKTFPKSNSFEYESSSSDSEDDADGMGQIVHSAINMSPKFYNADIFQIRPYLMPFIERRRLSQCKEEEDEDEADKSPQPQSTDQSPKFEMKAKPTPPPPPPAKDKASVEKFKDLERLRQQFMHKIDSINTNNVEDIKTVTVTPEMSTPPPPPPIPPTILPPALINLLESAKSSTVTQKSFSQIVTSPISSRNQQPRSPSPETLIIKGKFTVTKAPETPELPQLRPEVDKLKHLDSSTNAYTISFPSSFGGYSSVQGLFSQRYGSHKYSPVTPHLSKKFFDSSLVEIRTSAGSASSLNSNNSDIVLNPRNSCDNSNSKSPTTRTTSATELFNKRPDLEYRHLDDVWIKRLSNSQRSGEMTDGKTSSSVPKKQQYNTTDESAAESGRTTAVQSEDEQDAKLPSSRPSSAPAEPNAKAARKASKKMKEEARRQEKEASRREKEARKIERETARRLEREAAKLEKLNRNAEKISRSTERIGGTPRSGSLERRRSGDESPVLNQSTVHGIASPNRRPTIFDVFRPKTKSDARKQKMLLDPLSAAAAATGNEMGSASSTHSASGGSGGGGGIGVMNSMKVALQNSGLIGSGHHQKQHPAVTITTAEGTSVKNKYKDGSAHPHQGSDAQYYHTVTAVRRADASRSPMTKVMDLFRHRSNSAATEADKRKALQHVNEEDIEPLEIKTKLLF